MLSILIPAYNYDITSLVNELLDQCKECNIEFEIIVADDNPGSFLSLSNKIINTYSFCTFIQNQQNLGRTLTRHKLANAARYSTLLYLDADVIPKHKNFIRSYLNYIGTDCQVVVGGYAYQLQQYKKGKNLRYQYGLQREEKPAAFRNKNPYGSIFSGNFMIDKEVFLSNNYAGNQNFYGMDIYFGYKLFLNNVKVLHIDNPTYHLGLETDTVFFSKCLESVQSRKLLLENAPGSEQINSLLRYHNVIKKYHLRGLVALSFKVGKPLLRSMIFKKNPNLFCLDLYRLGYFCSLK